MMEFPSTGERCSVENCRLLDFLPVPCVHCQLTFCKDHAAPDSHGCAKRPDNIITDDKLPESIPKHKCSHEGCRTKDVVEMPCVVCRQHFCLTHRHHGCIDKTPSQEKRDKVRLPKEQFKKAKAETDKMVEERLRTAKNRALANKIKLMKIKSTAVGDNHVLTKDRIYFSVAPPLLGKDFSQHRNLFVSKTWTLGKCLDSFAKKFKIKEGYDSPGEPKLKLFDLEGKPICGPLSDPIASFMDSGVIVDGDSLILEYVPDSEKDNELYDLLTDKAILEKYKFS